VRDLEMDQDRDFNFDTIYLVIENLKIPGLDSQSRDPGLRNL